jgi:hypothetical protein
MANQKKVITTVQFHTRIAEANAAYTQVTQGVFAQAGVLKTLMQSIDVNKELIEESLLTGAVALSNHLCTVVKQSTDLLEVGKAVLLQPPQFYPFSTERLDDWELTLGSEYVSPVIDNFAVMVEGITAMGNLIDSITPPTDKVVDNVG